ncbi:MAG TPA: VCBS domain-containing protein, partial [Ramlibacter sp.]|nr:VCBS domain-containing protein [Ramlibacter sp.]
AGTGASGTATDTDVDNAANTFQAVAAGAASVNGYGTWGISSSGAWTYTVNESNAAVQALNTGGTLTDTFTIHTVDNTPQVVTVTIHGANDAAVLSGGFTGSVIEAGGVGNSVSGQSLTGGYVSVSDVDLTSSGLQSDSGATSYGSFDVFASGDWLYTVDDNNATVEALNVGGTLTDTFSVQAADGTSHTITITIHGANDAATFSGTLSGNATEAGGVANGTAGSGASGTATVADVDNAANVFQAVAAGAASNGGHGTWGITAGGAWTYTVNESDAAVQALNAGGTLTDTFTIHSADGTAATVTVTINGANDTATIGGASSAAATEAGGVGNATAGTTASGTATDSDVDNTANTFQAVAAGAASTNGYGTWGITAGGTWTYTVNESNAAVQALNTGGTLTDTFTIQSADGTAQTITITVNGANDAAVVGGALTGSATEAGGVGNATAGSAASGTATAADVDNTANTFQAVAAGAASTNGYGTWGITSGGAWTFAVNESNAAVQALNAGGTLSDTFTIHTADGTAQVVSVTINGANDAANIGGQSSNAVVEAGGVGNASPGTQAASGTLTSTDVDNAANTFQAVAAGAATANGYGTFSVTAGGLWTYTLNDSNASVNALAVGQTLTDTFTVLSADGTAQTVTITVNGANDAAVVGGATSGSATEAGGVGNATPGSTASGTATDTDVDNTANTFQAVAAGAASTNGHGTWGITAAGLWTYTVNENDASVQALNAGGTLSDTFTIHTADGTAQVVTVTVNGANDAATIGGTTSGSVIEAGGAANANAGTPTASGTATSADPDNAANTFQAVGSPTASANGFGTFTVTSGGAWTYTLNNSNAAVEALALGATLSDNFTILSADGTAKTVTVTINGANDNPLANSETAIATEDAASTVGNLLSNDTDVDNPHILSVANVNLIAPAANVNGTYGVLHVTSAGHFTYQLDNSSALVDSLKVGDLVNDTFSYVISDGNGGTSSAQLVVHVNGANDAPVGVADSGSANESGLVAGSQATGNVLTNDTDVDNGATRTAVAGTIVGVYGTMVLGSNGVYTYTANDANAAVNALASGETLTDTLSYQVMDEHNATGVGQVTITIHGADDAPVASNDTGTAGEAGASTSGFDANGNVLPNDADVDHLTVLSVSAVNGNAGNVANAVDGSFGQLVLNANGTYTYVIDDADANVDALGPTDVLHDIFTYTVSDGNGGTSTAQLDITIQGANDSPTGFVTINGTALQGNTLTATNNLADPEGMGTLHYQWTSNGFDILGATNSSFTVTASQAGTTIGVDVSWIDGGGTTETSSATVTAIPGQDIVGTGHGDNLVGTAGGDTLDGGAGADTLAGGAGNDVYFVDIGRDLIVENFNEGNDSVISRASYTLVANVENLTLAGTAVIAIGNGEDNVIIGNRSNNQITGLGGSDTMTGGLGADMFIFKSVGDSDPNSYDVITDFNAAQKDKIDLRAIHARANLPSDTAFKFIGTAAFDPNANNAGLLRFDPITHMLEGSINADATVEFRILLVGVDHIGKDFGGINVASFLL